MTINNLIRMLKFKDYTDYKQKTFINDNDNSTKIRLPFRF